MKFTLVASVLLLIFSSLQSISKETPKNRKIIEEQPLAVSPDPANGHLEVKIIQSLTSQKDTSKRFVSIQVQVSNDKGIMVYSSTKNVNQFSVFTGGLPEGEYVISCQIDTVILKKKFVVKH